jgi:hypothetical protein
MEQDLNKAINDILAKVGIEFIDLPKKNKSVRGSFDTYLDTESAAKIYEIYKDDFTFFGYSPKIDEVMPVDPKTSNTL